MISSAAKAAFHVLTFGTAEAVPFQNLLTFGTAEAVAFQNLLTSGTAKAVPLKNRFPRCARDSGIGLRSPIIAATYSGKRFVPG